LKDAKPDFVYETTPWWTSYFTGLMCKILRIKFIMRLMNDNMLDSRFKKTNSKFERTLTYGAFKFADYILPQNRYQNSRLNEMYPGKKIKTFFPPFVIDRRYLNVKENPGGYIAWVANFRYQKNLKMLFEVASVLTEFQIKIAGTALPNMDEETQTYLKKLKELPNVEFVGTVGRDEILSFFSKSAYLLNTSRYEGFSNAFLEAFVTGTPILSTNTVNPDGIIDGFGLGVVYYSAEKLGDLLKSVTPDEYARLSSNCLEYVQAGHGHLNLGKQLIDFLEGTND
jgi:glycosyltransferase involved in cell wall biosynthesis